MAQEYPISDVLYSDMLELRSGWRAKRIAEKLWQVEQEVEVQKGYLEKSKRYYIELQDIEILDIEIRKKFIWKYWKRYFPKGLKRKLIKVVFET